MSFDFILMNYNSFFSFSLIALFTVTFWFTVETAWFMHATIFSGFVKMCLRCALSHRVHTNAHKHACTRKFYHKIACRDDQLPTKNGNIAHINQMAKLVSFKYKVHSRKHRIIFNVLTNWNQLRTVVISLC